MIIFCTCFHPSISETLSLLLYFQAEVFPHEERTKRFHLHHCNPMEYTNILSMLLVSFPKSACGFFFPFYVADLWQGCLIAWKAKEGGRSWLKKNSPRLWSHHDKGIIYWVEKLLIWLFSPCVLSSTASASEDMSESDSAIWYLLQECEKQTLEEYGKPELTQFSDTLSPDLVEFER